MLAGRVLKTALGMLVERKMEEIMNEKSLIMAALIAGLSGFGLAGTHYVVPYGTQGVTPTPPYTNWPTAGTNLHEVIAAANAPPRERAASISTSVVARVSYSGATTG